MENNKGERRGKVNKRGETTTKNKNQMGLEKVSKPKQWKPRFPTPNTPSGKPIPLFSIS